MARQRVEGICHARGVSLRALELHLITAPVLRLDVPADLDRLNATVQTIRPRLLLLDPLVRLHSANENDTREVAHLLQGLRTLQRLHDLTVVLVHHARKNGSGSAGLSLRGSSDIYAWLDSFIYLQRRQDRSYLLQVEHRFDRSPEPLALALATDGDGTSPRLEIDPQGPAPLHQRQPGTLADSIVDELRAAAQPLTRTALRARLKVNNSRLGEVLNELAQAGRIARSHSPEGWTLAQLGRSVPALHHRDRSERND
jgi:hypothetical protein